MSKQPVFFDANERLKVLSAAGDPLERLRAVVDFGTFRGGTEAALERGDRSRGGRPPYDAVLMFRILVLQTLYTLSDDQTGYQLRDRLSFMRFAGLALHDPVPDAKTIWLFREQLTRAGVLARLFERFDRLLHERGYLAMGGQIVDVTVVEARRPRLTREEKETLRGGDTPAGWSKARTRQIDRDGSQLGAVLDLANTASDVWADTPYRGRANVALLEKRGLVAQFQRAKPRGKPMPAHIAPGNATRARVRSRVEHVFAATKVRMGLVVSTIGLARATAKITLANLAYNLTRFVWCEGRMAPA